jgi:hypothetical protein
LILGAFTVSRHRVERSQNWWREIDAQLRSGHAFVYVPDLCIAEAFKVLAKKYYVDGSSTEAA